MQKRPVGDFSNNALKGMWRIRPILGESVPHSDETTFMTRCKLYIRKSPRVKLARVCILNFKNQSKTPVVEEDIRLSQDSADSNARESPFEQLINKLKVRNTSAKFRKNKFSDLEE